MEGNVFACKKVIVKPHAATRQGSRIALGEALKSIIRVESAALQSKKKKSYFAFSALVPNLVVWPLQQESEDKCGL